MRRLWLCLALLCGCGAPEYARVELSDGRWVIARVLDEEPPGLDTGTEVITLGEQNRVVSVEEVPAGEWHLAAGAACLELGRRDEGLRHLRIALEAPERSVVEVARRRLAALEEEER